MEPRKNNDNNGRWLAAIITLLLTGGTVALLFNTFMNATKADAQSQQQYLLQDSIFFGGDFVMLGDTPEDLDDELAADNADEEQVNDEKVEPEATEEAHDLKDNGREAKENKPLVSDKRESPMKVKEEPKKDKDTGKAKPNNDKKEQNKTKPDKPGKTTNTATNTATTTTKPNSKINNRVGNSFAQGGGKQGDPTGNSNTGGKNASAGFNGTDGYTVANFVYPDRPYLSEGTIRIKVVVNPRGKVTSASYAGGSGKAASDASLKKRCEDAARKSSFSVKKSTTTNGIGTITYIIK